MIGPIYMVPMPPVHQQYVGGPISDTPMCITLLFFVVPTCFIAWGNRRRPQHNKVYLGAPCEGGLDFRDVGERVGMSAAGAHKAFTTIIARFIKAYMPETHAAECHRIATTSDGQLLVRELVEYVLTADQGPPFDPRITRAQTTVEPSSDPIELSRVHGAGRQ